MNIEKTFLGRGWSFPPTFSQQQKGVAMAANVEDIRQSLHVLLSTKVGERLMHPDYGCNLDELLFESLNTTLATYIEDLVERAILLFEPRIELKRVNLTEEEPGTILIEIDYVVRSTNRRENYVFPFYKEEGTNL
jgi:phage baseplate assembly protein W